MFGNNVQFLGRLTADIELKTAGTTTVANFSLARNRMKTEKNPEPEADFVRFVAFGKTAEVLSQYFHKGDRVGINGRLQTSNFTDKDGNKRSSTEVVVDNIEFIETKNSNASADTTGASHTAQASDVTSGRRRTETAADTSSAETDYPF